MSSTMPHTEPHAPNPPPTHHVDDTMLVDSQQPNMDINNPTASAPIGTANPTAADVANSMRLSMLPSKKMRANSVTGKTSKRKHVCTYAGCGKSFTQIGNLKVHERCHTGEKPFGCGFPGCGKRFTQLGNKKAHEALHLGYKPYICIEYDCNKSFNQFGNLKSHQLRAHNKLAPQPKLRAKLEREMTMDGMSNADLPMGEYLIREPGESLTDAFARVAANAGNSGTTSEQKDEGLHTPPPSNAPPSMQGSVSTTAPRTPTSPQNSIDENEDKEMEPPTVVEFYGEAEDRDNILQLLKNLLSSSEKPVEDSTGDSVAPFSPERDAALEIKNSNSQDHKLGTPAMSTSGTPAEPSPNGTPKKSEISDFNSLLCGLLEITPQTEQV